MEAWTPTNVSNLAGIYTILFCMVGVCYVLCDPIGGFKQPPQRQSKTSDTAAAAQASSY